MLSAAELRERVGLAADDASQDALLTALEKEAVAYLERETRRYFGPAQVVTEYAAPVGQYLFLKNAPNGPVVITENRMSGTVLLPDSAFAVDGDALMRLSGSWEKLTHSVTYMRGFEPGEEPGDVREAVAILVEFKFNRRGTAGFESKGDTGFSWRVSDTVPGLAEFISHHRRPLV